MNRRELLRVAGAAATLGAVGAPGIVLAQNQRVLKFVPHADLAVLDPVFSPAYVTRHHAYLVFDTLFGMDANLRPVLQMAESAGTESDGRIWTIKLRSGLKFHDGAPVLARDCVASIRRWALRDGFGQVLMSVTDELSAADDRTIRFRLKTPFPLLPNALGKVPSFMPAMMPERLAKADPTTQVTEMIGSGPYRFKLDERVPGARVVYERFADYVPRADGVSGWTGGPKTAHFDRVEWVVIPDASTAAAALQSGEVDWWEYPLHDLLPMLKRNRNVRVETSEPTGMIPTLRFNTVIKPFDNPAIRRALLGAVDQEEFMRAQVGSDASMFRTGVGVFCPGTPMASDAGMEVLTGPRDYARVKSELEKAGYDGQKIVLLAGVNVADVKNSCDVAAEMMRKVGMNVDYQALDWGTVIQRRSSREPVENGGWNCYCSSWGGLDQLDPSAHLLLRGDGGFFGWPKSDELERLRHAWFQAPDLAGQQAIAAQIQKQAFVDTPYLPLGQYIQPTAYRSSVEGVKSGFATFWGVCRA